MGAARIRLRARRLARLRPLARLRRALVAARDRGFRRLHRMGRHAQLVERQGRLQRHLVLRRQPMAGRGPRPQASGGDLRLGGFRGFYRELSHNGGIYSTFAQNWYNMQIRTVQYGLGSKGHRSRMNGDWVSGPKTLSDEQMGSNRYDLGKMFLPMRSTMRIGSR